MLVMTLKSQICLRGLRSNMQVTTKRVSILTHINANDYGVRVKKLGRVQIYFHYIHPGTYPNDLIST